MFWSVVNIYIQKSERFFKKIKTQYKYNPVLLHNLQRFIYPRCVTFMLIYRDINDINIDKEIEK